MRAHEAGALHADGYGGPPIWLPAPGDVTELMPQLWPSSVRRNDDGELTVAGVSVEQLASEFGTPAYVLDEQDFRSRARAFRDGFADAFGQIGANADVYYAGKAFLCTAVVRWVMDEGLGLDVATGGELAVAQRAGMPGERIALHGNNKTSAELEQALRYGVGRIVVDSFDELDRIEKVAGALGVIAPVMIRVTVGVEAHTHEFIATGHEDQKFGFSLTGGEAQAAAERVLATPGAFSLLGLHSHIGSQIFDTGGFELAARRLLQLQAQLNSDHDVTLPEVDLGGGFGMAYTSAHTPLTPAELGSQLAGIVEHECRELGLRELPRVSVEPGRAIVGPAMFTLYRVGTIKDVVLEGGLVRRYVSIDGGMSDNIRTALYNADYSCTLASRDSEAGPQLSRVVGRHCESGDIVVLDEYLPADLAIGDLIAVPGTGAYCRSMANQYNHTPRPPVVAVNDGAARLIVRGETIDDLLALDVDSQLASKET